MLLTKEVEVKLWAKNVKYYHDLGYEGNKGDIIIVKVEDLSCGSHTKVDVLCDYCKTEILHIPYKRYNNTIKDTGTCACTKCAPIKYRETNLKKYGVASPMMLNETKQKIKNTLLERYGVDNYAKTKECYNKAKETNRIKYGTDNPAQNEHVKEKARKTNLQRYGTEYPSQNQYVKQKKANVFYERYGVTTSLQIDSGKKLVKSLYESGGVATSKQQIYLHNLYGGKLNYPVSYYLADICFPDDKMIVEYNGGGHDLSVKIRKLTQEEFEHKELVRDTTIKKEGYKIMKIISTKDLLPSDTILLQMLNESRTYFNSTPHTWCTFDIDNSTIRNAEHKTGTPYDFGELRQIKEAS